MGMAGVPPSPGCTGGSGDLDYSHPFAISSFIPTPSASALSFPLSLPFRAFPAGQRRLLIPLPRWLQLLMLFRKAPNPMLLFT